MRALKILTIGMGVLILAGTGLLVAVIVHRSTTALPSGPVSLSLHEPAGSHIAGIAATQDRLAIELQGGGSDRVLLVDPHSGAITGQISLAR